MTINQLRELAISAVNGKPCANHSLEATEAALRDGFKDLAPSINEFMRNRYDIYEIIIEAAEEYLPRKTFEVLGQFAEIRQVGQGQKALFKTSKIKSKMRARKFLTQVGLSGTYETFRLDSETFEVSAHAVGGATRIDFERYLDGAEDFVELMEVINEGLVDAVVGEVQRALIASFNSTNRPVANKVASNGFDGAAMFKLCNIASAYGDGATIFATPEFVADMGPDAIVPVPTSGNYGGVYHPDDIDSIHYTGYIKVFRGFPVVQIPQSYVDTNNVDTWVNPQFAYILPGGKSKVVKVVLEGQTQVYDFQGADRSMEINVYKKIGAAILTHYNWCIYQNYGIADTSVNPWGVDTTAHIVH